MSCPCCNLTERCLQSAMPAYCFRQRTAGSPALRYSQTLQAPRPDCRLHPDSRLFRSLFCQRLPHSPDRRRMPVRSNLRRCCTLRFDTLHSRCCDFGFLRRLTSRFLFSSCSCARFPACFCRRTQIFILLRIIGVIIQLSTVFIAAGHILRRLDSVPAPQDFASLPPIWKNLQYAALPPGFSDDCGTQKCPSLSSPPVPERPKLS